MITKGEDGKFYKDKDGLTGEQALTELQGERSAAIQTREDAVNQIAASDKYIAELDSQISEFTTKHADSLAVADIK